MRRVILWVLMLLEVSSLCAQNHSDIDLVMRFLGVASPEELVEDDLEHFMDYISNPLELNMSSVRRLLSCGLFSRYQVMSFIEYRKEHGDVLSLAELAAVDGFGENFVAKLTPFIRLSTTHNPGETTSGTISVHNDIAAKSAVRIHGEDGFGYNYGLKYRMNASERLCMSMSLSKAYGEDLPSAASASLYWNSRNGRVELLAGDFNARFGQGLVLWNGLSINDLSTPSSFRRNPSFISRTWSYTGSTALSGLASAISFGQCDVSLLLVSPSVRKISSIKELSLMPAANFNWNMKNGQMALTHYLNFSSLFAGKPRIPDMKTSADMQFCFNGTDLFGEIAYDWVNKAPAAILGSQFPAGESIELSVMSRYYHGRYDPVMSGAPRSGTKCTNECSVSAAMEYSGGRSVVVKNSSGLKSTVARHDISLSADAAIFPATVKNDRRLQYKGTLLWNMQINPILRLSLRLKGRYRSWETNRLKTDIRADLAMNLNEFYASVRLNAISYVGFGLLGYAEGGYRDQKYSLYLRFGMFRIDNWDDRIYSYERDAPGSFSVPSYYGRGFWTSLNGSWRYSRWGRLYARFGLKAYPFMHGKEKKPGNAELKIQSVISF